MNKLEPHPLISALVAAYAALPGVRAIGITGGVDTLPAPGTGDIDLFVYCSRIPHVNSRLNALQKTGATITDITTFPDKSIEWGVIDGCIAEGIETWFMLKTVAEERRFIRAIQAGSMPYKMNNYFYAAGRCAMLQTMIPLYDPEFVLERFKKETETMPETYGKKTVHDCRDGLADLEDLERAASRGDVPFYHFALDIALDHFLILLWTVNSVYFPSRKRSFEIMEKMAVKPANCVKRLAAVIENGARATTLVKSLTAWKELANDLLILAGKQVV